MEIVQNIYAVFDNGRNSKNIYSENLSEIYTQVTNF
jgi:hypothetical protein